MNLRLVRINTRMRSLIVLVKLKLWISHVYLTVICPLLCFVKR